MTDWVIIDVCDEHLSECLDCSYVGTDWAENDKYIFDTETGENHVFCPRCHSENYFLVDHTKLDKRRYT